MSGAELQEHLITLAEVPALVASIGAPTAAAERGTVLVLHGLTASNDVQRAEAHSLAAQGPARAASAPAGSRWVASSCSAR